MERENLDLYFYDEEHVLMIPNHNKFENFACIKADGKEFCTLTGADEENVCYKYIKAIGKTVVFALKTDCPKPIQLWTKKRNVFNFEPQP